MSRLSLFTFIVALPCVILEVRALTNRIKSNEANELKLWSKSLDANGTLLEASCEKLRKNGLPPGMRKVHVSAGFTMVVLGPNDIVSQSIATTGYWEVSSISQIASHASTSIAEDAVFLDIGANLGYYTLLFAHQGHKVIAVEPMTRNRMALQASICLNNLQQSISVVSAALSTAEDANGPNRSCVVRSTNTEINIGNGHLYCAGDAPPCAAGEQNCEMVPVKTLDAVLTELAPASVDVVKMDVEEYECNVLAGGASLFDTFKPSLLQIEVTNVNSRECVSQKATQYGYSLHPAGDNMLMTRE